MHASILLMIGLLGVGPAEYSRRLDAKHLDQATLDEEGYGSKKAFQREDGGLRIKLGAGEAETGWKTPQQLKIGGNFVITAELLIKTLPKPAQEDGAAIGLAIAFQDVNQPDLTLLRLREPGGPEVYRSVDKGLVDPTHPPVMQMQMQMMFMQGPPPKPAKPPRKTFPASGEAVRMELRREGPNVELQVNDVATGRPRYLGQIYIGPNDVAAVKLFASNRNGVESVDVLIREFSIRADRLNGLGTMVRTVFDTVAYGDPTAIEGGLLIVGGPSKAPPATAPNGPPAAQPQPTAPVLPSPAVPAAVAPVAAPAPALVVAPAAPGVVVAAAPESNVPVAAPAPPPTSVAAAAPNQPPPSKEPKAKIPLDEVASIRFERTPALTGRFVGQSNLDFTMPHPDAKKVEAKKDEKKDEAKKDEKKDEAKKDEKKDEAKKDEKKDEAKKDEPKKDEPKKEEPKKEEPKKEEPKKEEPKKEEPKKPAEGDDPNAPPPGTAAAAKVVPKVDPKKNGIRDLNLSLSGLRPTPIRQVTVNCQTDKGPTGWQLDTSGSQNWPLVLRRSGLEAWADLFLEPPPGDCFQKDFTVAVMYQDNQNANVTIKADKHSDPALATDPKGPATPRPDAWVHLSGDEKLFGKLEAIGEDVVKITTPWQDHLDVPLTRVVGIHLALIDPKESAESFARRLKARGSEDLLLARTKDGEVIAIAGVLEGSEVDRLLFRYQGKTRKLPIEQVEGLVMAARPEPDQPDVPRSTFALPGGVTVTGRWKALEPTTWKVETPWGQEVNLPAPDVQDVRFRGGKITYLSDLNPTKVEETPFFGRKFSWKRDASLLGEPLKMDGRPVERGVAVHSRSSLTYDLNGRYATFEALVGFDEASMGKGRVDCRVLADGKEIYANPDLRADAPPVKLNLPVAGAEQLRLLVDFGKGQDTGDRVIWANARLYRKEKN